MGKFGTLWNYVNLACAYLRLNFAAQLEYRGAFISQVIGMALNDCVWLAFWCLFFNRFPALRGWTEKDVITMWSISAGGFGLAFGLCGNARNLASLIVRGQLETWMLYPRVLLSHLLFGKMVVTGWGDLAFGLGAYIFLVHPDLKSFALFLVLVLTAAIVFVGFAILTGSLAFYLSSSEVLSEQCIFALVTFSTYPATLFDGGAKLLLFTLIPAAFISYCPVEALRHFSWEFTVAAIGGAAAVLALGIFSFYYGLSRYESGNLLEMRG
jgi:ABC-2 type transport system permease protein